MDELFKVFAGRCLYDPKKKVAKWDLDIEVQCRGLTEEQQSLVRKIIGENRNGHGISVLHNILNALAHVGFRGEVQHSFDFNQPLRIIINSKIDK